ncbi:MAG: PAS domain S-box protein [Candidatus Latescibacterota bacterium]
MTAEPPEPTIEVEQLRSRVADLEATQHRQQQTIDALRQRTEDSEARFRNVFDYSNDAILLLDPDLDEILDVNGRGCRLFGYTRQKLQALAISAIFPP